MPDTGTYLILGLAATALIIGFLVISMVVRQRNLDRDLELIRELKEDDSP
jgi:general stress protein CsbA